LLGGLIAPDDLVAGDWFAFAPDDFVAGDWFDLRLTTSSQATGLICA
jgi:hypothetical protein